MNKIKRTFALIIAFTLIIGTFGAVVPAFAETDTEALNIVPEDVIGTEHEGAIRRLVAFGLIEGYPDGTYKPEREVNRAQFAKLLVYALGLEDAAMAVQGSSTGFSDVGGDYWAAGYINIASTQGLIKGYPDGTFRPAEKVTYAHTLTMLVRALGYEDQFLPGNWPGNYIAKATDVGITKGLSLPADSKAGGKRGIVAQLINNTLDSKVVKIRGYAGEYGVEYEEQEETLLMDRLEISKYKDTRVVADKVLDDDLGKDRVRVKFLENIDSSKNKEVKNSYKANEIKTFDSKYHVRSLIGEEVTTYLTRRDEVIYIEKEDDDRVYFDYVEEIKGKEVSLVKSNRDYEFADDADVHLFKNNSKAFELYSGNSVKHSDLLGRMGKFVIRNNKIVFAEILNPEETIVVMNNDNGLIQGVRGTDENFRTDLRKDGNYDNSLVYNTKGEEIGLRDIKSGNLIYIQKQDYDGDEIALVTVVQDNKIEGVLGRVQRDSIRIGGKTVDVVKAGTQYRTYYKVDEYAGVKAWNNTSWNSDMKDAEGKQATAFTDAVGRVVFLNVMDGDSDYKFGIVTRTYADRNRVKIYTTVDGVQGKDTIFTAESASDLKVKQKLVGSAVKFRLNSDGEIAEGKFEVKPYGSAVKMAKGEDFGKDIIKANNGKSYAIALDDITIINAPNVQGKAPVNIKTDYGDLQGESYGRDKKVDIGKFETKTWDAYKETEYDKDVEFYLFTKDNAKNQVEGLIFIGQGSSEEVAVYVLDQWKRGSDTIVEYVTYPENEKQTRVLEGLYAGRGDLQEKAYIGEERATGELMLYYSIPSAEKEHFDLTIIRDAKIEKISGDFIEITQTGKTGKESIYIKGSLVYHEDGSKSSSYLKEGYIVDIIMDGERARLIQLKVK